MKVEFENGRLILKQPALLFLVPFGGLFVAIASVAGVFTASLTRLACDPTACQLITTYLVLVPPSERTLPLSSIEQARVDRQRSSGRSGGGSSTTYRVMLDTTTGTVPLSNVATSNRSGKERQANQINQFLANPRGEFEWAQNEYWLGLVFFLAFGIPGLILMLAGTTSTTWTLDRMLGKLIIDRQDILGRRQREHSLAEFTGVSLNQAVSASRRRRRRSRKSQTQGNSSGYQVDSGSYQVDLDRPGTCECLASGSLDDMRAVAQQVQTYMGYALVQENVRGIRKQ